MGCIYSWEEDGATGSALCAGNWQHIFTLAFLSAEPGGVELSWEVNS